MADPKETNEAAEQGTSEQLEGGSYDVIRKRLLDQAAELLKRANALNDKRTAIFGGSQITLAATERIRTENNCVPCDIRAIHGKLLFGFNVFVGMRTETQIADVFSVHNCTQKGEEYDLSAVPLEEVDYLNEPDFIKEFGDLYKYSKQAKLLQIVVSETRLLAVFQTGEDSTYNRVFRWGVEKDGSIKFIDTRGEEDNVAPRSHDFEWVRCTRENQVSGRFPHMSVLDEVFVETSGGDLTIKIENNTEQGEGIYSEPVEEKNQSIDDADIQYAKVGTLILLKIKPYREPEYRYFVFNTRLATVLRNDTIGQACLELPEDQGVIFPGGYYLRTGDYKIFEENTAGIRYKRTVKSPNGEDVLYVFHRLSDGHYLLLPYNLIRKEVTNPIHCHGYSVFSDGRMIVFRATSDEPTRVHPVQIWNTPFFSQEHAASAPTDGSFLSKVGNADLVRGISEVLTLRSLAVTDTPTRQTYEDVISTASRLGDTYYWINHAESGNILETVHSLKSTAELIVDEFEKVNAMKKRAAESLAEAEESQSRLLAGLRPEDMRSVEEFMQSLAQLRHQRGHLITLREMRYMNLPRIDELEQDVVAQFDHVSKGCVEFLLGETALKPLLDRLGEVIEQVEATTKASDLLPVDEDLDQVNEGLTVLSDVIANLAIDDATKRTEILEGISEVYSQLNRARATLASKRKELSSAEGRAEFSAQFKLFSQSVVSALAVCDTPERCDDEMSRLLVALEELEGRFSEFDEFLADLADKREEITEAIGARRQTLLDERQRRAANIIKAAERILSGITRRARSLPSADELNAYFASDAMVLKCRDLAKQLIEIGDAVKADEIESKIKSAKQDALRGLRDKLDLFEDGENVIKLGRHKFNVSTQALELTIVPRESDGGDTELYLHLTGTDFYERLDDDSLNQARDLWDQQLISENRDVYRGEFLAGSMFFDAEVGASGLTMEQLVRTASDKTGLLNLVRQYSQTRHDEGYERGVHDSDAAAILEKLVSLSATAGLLKYASPARGLAVLHWSELSEEERNVLSRRGQSAGRLRQQFESAAAQRELGDGLVGPIGETNARFSLGLSKADARAAARYLAEELASPKPRLVVSAAAVDIKETLLSDLDRASGRREFEEDLRCLESLPPERLALVMRWIDAAIARAPDLARHAEATLEAAVYVCTEKRVDREKSTGAVEVKVEGLLGNHRRVVDRAMTLKLDEFLVRLDGFRNEQVSRFRAYRELRHEVIERQKRRLRLEEFQPRILSSFVRNKLIDEVYLPIIGDNLAKQMGAAGDTKRTDLMGLLMLISPPGYGKTTLMEYVANVLGLIFMKINGPSLGHEVKSLDPEEAPNATARQEVDKLNLALEMGNNVMIYVDDIQHTNSEFLQKFISLCDAQRRIEGVWKGRTRTYDLRGKKVAVVMAGNPYTETGEKFSIPDMLANRADTYNLGDILEGKDHVFALSYIENALTSNPVLSPLSGREPADTYKLIKMAQGEEIPTSELSYAYSAAEVSEIVDVLKRMFICQKVVLMVNQQYILSASQDDAYRTEPPFKLQGSYRNMNKLAEKIVAAHTEQEIEELLDDHYNGESQTLTTGAEQNLLKLAEMRGRMSEAQTKRWEEIKQGFVRVKTMGSGEDDPVNRVTGTLGGLAEQLSGINKSLGVAIEDARSRAEKELVARQSDETKAWLGKIETALDKLARPQIDVQVERDPAIAELLSQQLAMVDQTLLPIAEAALHSSVAATAQQTTMEQLRKDVVAAMERAQGADAERLAQMAAKMSELIDAQRAAVADVKKVAEQSVEQAAAIAAQEAKQGSDLVAAQAQMRQAAEALAAQVAQAQQQTQAAAQAIAQHTAEAKQVAHAQAQAVQATQAAAQHAAQAAQAGQAAAQRVTEHAQAAHQSAQHLSQHLAQQAAAGHAQAQQAAAHTAQAHAASAPQPTGMHAQAYSAAHHGAQLEPRGSTMGQMLTQPGRASTPQFVQRPGASAEENFRIAQMQLAAQRAAREQSGQQQLTVSVQRVEHRIAELGNLIRTLQDRLAQGVAQARSEPPRFDVALTMSSESNFYSSVAGGNVVREGGVFVQTYRKLPQRGSNVTLRINMPGGPEFDALALVEWTREARGPGQKPGFGARILNLPGHAESLVNQYIRSRAPLVFE